MSACLLSSYVPVATGPLSPATGTAVHAATQYMKGRGAKRSTPAGVVDVGPIPQWYDGGLAAMFPKIDDGTMLVSPVSIRSKSNIVICPQWVGGEKGLKIGSR